MFILKMSDVTAWQETFCISLKLVVKCMYQDKMKTVTTYWLYMQKLFIYGVLYQLHSTVKKIYKTLLKLESVITKNGTL